MREIERVRPNAIPEQFVNGASIKLATPMHFIRAIRCFKQTWEKALSQQKQKYSHVEKGLSVLTETQAEVANKKQELAKKTIELEEATKMANDKLKEMVSKRSEAESKKQKADSLRQTIIEKQKIIDEKKGPIMAELAEAEPAIKAAKAAISGIDKRKLDELKAMAKPPEMIKLAMEAVMLIAGSEEDKKNVSWEAVRKAIRRPDFIKEILAYDAENAQLSQSIINQLKTNYFSKIKKEQVYKASTAAGPMYEWAISVQRFQEVSKKVEPLTNEIK